MLPFLFSPLFTNFLLFKWNFYLKLKISPTNLNSKLWLVSLALSSDTQLQTLPRWSSPNPKPMTEPADHVLKDSRLSDWMTNPHKLHGGHPDCSRTDSTSLQDHNKKSAFFLVRSHSDSKYLHIQQDQCTTLYHTILCCSILYHTILFYTTPYNSLPYHTIFYCF